MQKLETIPFFFCFVVSTKYLALIIISQITQTNEINENEWKIIVIGERKHNI